MIFSVLNFVFHPLWWFLLESKYDLLVIDSKIKSWLVKNDNELSFLMFDETELSQKLYYESDSLDFLSCHKVIRNPS
jgi:hypothetical protein